MGTVDVDSIVVGGTKYYRVRVGPFTGADAAQTALPDVVSAGAIGAKVVVN